MKFKLHTNGRFSKKNNINSCNGKEVNDLDNIKCELLNYTPVDALEKYIPELVMATWNNDINEFRNTLTEEDKNEIMDMFFKGKCIPTALRSVQITVLVTGITTHDVTHLIRHTGLSYAADCTGDKYVENRNLIVPTFFDSLPKEYKDRYIQITKDSYKLYDDICNNFTDKVHIQDIRLVLPRTLETFYYITGNLFDFIRMLNQRIDLQFQPKSDNILALRIYEQLKKVYPKLNIDIHRKNNFYCNLAKDDAILSSNWYNPLPQDVDENTSKLNTVYGDMTKMYGYDKYKQLEKSIEEGMNK